MPQSTIRWLKSLCISHRVLGDLFLQPPCHCNGFSWLFLSKYGWHIFAVVWSISRARLSLPLNLSDCSLKPMALPCIELKLFTQGLIWLTERIWFRYLSSSSLLKFLINIIVLWLELSKLLIHLLDLGIAVLELHPEFFFLVLLF